MSNVGYLFIVEFEFDKSLLNDKDFIFIFTYSRRNKKARTNAVASLKFSEKAEEKV